MHFYCLREKQAAMLLTPYGGHEAKNCRQPLGARSSPWPVAGKRKETSVIETQGNEFCQ